MLGITSTLSLIITSLLYHSLGQPVTTRSFTASASESSQSGKRALTYDLPINADGLASSSTPKAKKFSRTPSSSERKKQYKPRTSSRYITGTPREQVEQFRYRLPPKGPNESQESFEGRRKYKEYGLEERKRYHLKKITTFEKQYNNDEEKVSKEYNEWIQNGLKGKNLRRTRSALNRQDFTENDYQDLLLQKQQEDGTKSPADLSRSEQKKLNQRKSLIRAAIKTGDEHLTLLAKERMKRYGITDLSDGKKQGARKAFVRKQLDKDPNNLFIKEKAIELGMDSEDQPARKRKHIVRSSAQQGNQEALSTCMHNRNDDPINHVDFPTTSSLLAGPSHNSIPTYTAKNSILPFDLNIVPLIDEE